MHHVWRRLLAHEDYFGLRDKFVNLSSALDSIQRGESDVEENQIGVECLRCAFAQPLPSPEQQLPASCNQLRPACEIGIDPLRRPVVERYHVVLDRFDQPQALQYVQFLGILLR